MFIPRVKFSALAAIFVLVSMILGQPGICTERVNAQHDWRIELESQELKQKIGSAVSMQSEKMCRINVYAHANGTDAPRELIEQIWYVKGESNARGLRRLAKLPVPEGKSVEIKLTYKNTSPDEFAAKSLADATVRLLLEAYLNRDSVPLVQAPSEFSAAVLSGLNDKHFVVENNQADVVSVHPITFVLQTDSNSNPQRLVFQP